MAIKALAEPTADPNLQRLAHIGRAGSVFTA